MKAIKYIITASVLLVAFSCRTLEEYNESPNQIPVGEVPPSALMDELICSGAINCQQRFYDTYAELMQYTCITSSSNEVISRYYIAPSYIENCWNNFARWSANADHMYAVAVKAEMKNYQAVALTLRAMYIDMLTATFGPIPFTEAFQIREGNNKPVFDDEKTIYTQLILDLEKANELYKESSNLEDTMKDKLYYGDIKKWQKFSNSLMLRLLMRLSKRDDKMEIAWGESVVTKVKRIIENPASYPVMTEYTDNAAVYFTGEAPFQNGWGGYTEATLAGHRFTEHMYGLMKPQALGARGGDPRVYVWFMPYSASYGWIGIPSGIPGDDMQSAGYTVMNFQTMNNYKLPYSFMNCDEVYFLKAEAYANMDDDWKNITTSENIIRDLYNTGIRESCKFWRYIYCEVLGYDGRFIDITAQPKYRNFYACNTANYDDDTPLELPIYTSEANKQAGVVSERQTLMPVLSNPAIEDFYTNIVPFDMSNPLKCILEQKYIANFRVGLEGWCDYRRTGYPEMTILDGTYNNHILPYRLVYPNRTKTTNDANYQNLLRYLSETYYDGADDMLTPVWWSEAGLIKEIR